MLSVNTGYLGYPLTVALLGRDQLSTAVLYDVLVTGPCLLLGAFAVGAAFGTKAGESPRERVRAFFTRNPPLYAAIAGLLAPKALAPTALVDISQALIVAILPIGFFAVGATLAENAEHGELPMPPPLTRPVALAVGTRLAVVPGPADAAGGAADRPARRLPPALRDAFRAQLDGRRPRLRARHGDHRRGGHLVDRDRGRRRPAVTLVLMLHHVGIEVAPADIERSVELWQLLGFELVEPPAVAQRVHLAGTRGDPGPPDADRVADGAAARPHRGRRRRLRGDLRRPAASTASRSSAGREHWGAPRALVIAPGGHRVELMAAPPGRVLPERALGASRSTRPQ